MGRDVKGGKGQEGKKGRGPFKDLLAKLRPLESTGGR